MGNLWLHRYAVLVLACTWLLVIAGSLVTSNEGALSIPDWPLAYGKLIPPLEGNIRFEFAHRVLAATVALLTFLLAIWSRTALAWAAFAAVTAQALLGGAVVKLVDPKPIALAHACLAHLCFGLVVAVVVAQNVAQTLVSAASRLISTLFVPLVAMLSLYAQIVLGAAVRHHLTSIVPHLVGAGISTAAAMWAGLQILMRYMENALYRRSATALLIFTFLQIFLGLGAYTSRIITADDPQPMPLMITFTAAHVAVGSLAFGAAVALALIVYRDTPKGLAVA